MAPVRRVLDAVLIEAAAVFSTYDADPGGADTCHTTRRAALARHNLGWALWELWLAVTGEDTPSANDAAPPIPGVPPGTMAAILASHGRIQGVLAEIDADLGGIEALMVAPMPPVA